MKVRLLQRRSARARSKYEFLRPNNPQAGHNGLPNSTALDMPNSILQDALRFSVPGSDVPTDEGLAHRVVASYADAKSASKSAAFIPNNVRARAWIAFILSSSITGNWPGCSNSHVNKRSFKSSSE